MVPVGRIGFGLALALGLVAGVGCSDPAPSAAKAPAPVPVPAAAGGAITEAARTEAREIFSGRCTPCHGATGAGDGPASASLTPRPANFTSPVWQASVDDAHIEKIIKYGGAAVGKAPMMPGNPDLAAKEATVAALREHIRSLKK